MCGRARLGGRARLAAQQVLAPAAAMPTEAILCENLSPGEMVAIVVQAEARRPESRALLPAKWGLVPAYASVADHFMMMNARSDTVHELPSYRGLLANHRCVFVVDGFYEWRQEGKQKQPYLIFLPEPMLCPALYTENNKIKDEFGRPLRSFTILTTDACERLSWLHQRQPAVLTKEQAEQWLDPAVSASTLLAAIRASEKSLLATHSQWYKTNPKMNANSYKGADAAAEYKPASVLSFFTSPKKEHASSSSSAVSPASSGEDGGGGSDRKAAIVITEEQRATIEVNRLAAMAKKRKIKEDAEEKEEEEEEEEEDVHSRSKSRYSTYKKQCPVCLVDFAQLNDHAFAIHASACTDFSSAQIKAEEDVNNE